MRLGVVGNRGYPGLPDVLRTLRRLAPELGFHLLLEDELADLPGRSDRLGEHEQIDALLSLGGDGTMLRAARVVSGRAVPVLGINFGRLGFLTCCGPDELELALRHLAAGDYVAEPRMLLEAHALDRDGRERRRWTALNDVVLHKGGVARVVRLAVAADGESVAAYAADGLVVSTPTGSTAYNLSCGGPVMVPTMESIILTPISAHTLALRPLVLPPTAEVTIGGSAGPEELLVTVDGQIGMTFSSDDVLRIRRAERPALIVRFPATTFFSRLRRKLGWGGLAERDE
jgi:NAD+ kinase